jgi:hypothetical protein
MRSLAVLLCLAAAVTSFTLSAEECAEPAEPQNPPSGATASRDEMRVAQEAMKDYNAAVTEFSACAARNHQDPAKANEAVRKLKVLANRFNAELRAFRQKNGG